MPSYFIVNIQISDANEREKYDEYIAKVKPIVENYGGEYIVRSERITALSDSWSPDRIIIIKFASKDKIFKWLSAPEYKKISSLRIDSVDSKAIIVDEN